MATNERRALMRHLGLTLVSHSDVEIREYKDDWSSDKRKFAILKPEFAAGKRLSTADPKRIDRDFAFIKEGESFMEGYKSYLSPMTGETFAYADAPLRVAGLFTDGSVNSYLEYEVDKYGNQFYNRITPGRVRRYDANTDSSSGSLDLRGWKVVKLNELPHEKRIQLMYALAERKIMSGTDSRQIVRLRALQKRLVADHGYVVELGRVTRRGAPAVYGYRRGVLGGTALTDYEYTSLRTQLKELGTMIGRKDSDAGEFLDKVNALTFGSFSGVMFSLWSGLHPEHSIVNCHCGHVDMADRTVEGRGGQVICHTCIENGTYHLIQDLDQYDAGGHRHQDGLFYSYPEYHIEDEDDDDIDPDERGSHSGIRNYSTDVRSYLKSDPNIVPSSYGDFLMGVELEVVPEYQAAAAAEHTLHTLAKGYAILKHDGSLNDGGFEIVTAPRGLKEHIKRFSDWKPYSTLRAWDAGCCGTHVHISSQAFTASTLGKFIEFYNSPENDQLIQSIAGRHPATDGQAQSYCQRDGCQPGNPKKTLEDKSIDRYFMVNTSNMTTKEAQRLGLTRDHASGKSINTVEVRVFRASLKKSRLLAQIEFAHASVMFCRWSSMRELDQKHFLKWLKGMAGVYPNLAKWFGVRANTEVVEARPQARVGADV